MSVKSPSSSDQPQSTQLPKVGGRSRAVNVPPPKMDGRLFSLEQRPADNTMRKLATNAFSTIKNIPKSIKNAFKKITNFSENSLMKINLQAKADSPKKPTERDAWLESVKNTQKQRNEVMGANQTEKTTSPVVAKEKRTSEEEKATSPVAKEESKEAAKQETTAPDGNIAKQEAVKPKSKAQQFADRFKENKAKIAAEVERKKADKRGALPAEKEQKQAAVNDFTPEERKYLTNYLKNARLPESALKPSEQRYIVDFFMNKAKHNEAGGE